MAITSYRHPLLEYPDIPIVIVEGRFDEVYLTVAIREAGIRPRWRILSPDQSFGDGTAGDALKSYLKYNQAALQARPLAAPILVLRDWEAKDTGAYKKLLEPHPYSNAVTTPENLCNPQLGRSFVGIERYLSTEIILAHIAAKELLKPASGEEVYEVNKPAFIAKKRAISDSVQDGRTAGPYLVDLVKWLDSAVETLLDKVPPGEFAL